MDWYPHNISDYDTDTLHLSAEQDGVYARLLRWYYANERPLPDNDAKLAGIARISLDKWLEMADVMRAFFVTRDTQNTTERVLHHKRCDDVILTQSAKRRDWNKRQKKLRKHNILRDVTRDTGVNNAPRGEERRVEIAKEAISSSPASPLMSFDDFWKLYPRKVGKLAAERAFKRMLGKMPPADEMTAAINRTIANKKNDIDFPHPTTWINQGRWMDVEGEAAAPAPGPAFRLPDDAPAWRKSLLAQLGATKYISWIVGTEMRAAEKPGHFYVKSAFAATHLSVTFLKEIALACGCAEREIIFHVWPSKKEIAK